MATTDSRGGTATAASALSELFAGPLGAGLAPAAKAARAWYAANGDRERRHTTGVWLRKPGRAGADPVLVVALDSNLMAHELGTNKDIYLQRLAFHGIAISDIRFSVRKASGEGGRAGQAASSREKLAARKSQRDPQAELPELTPSERSRVDRSTQDLPDGLRESVSRAMCATLQRHKATSTQD